MKPRPGSQGKRNPALMMKKKTFLLLTSLFAASCAETDLPPSKSNQYARLGGSIAGKQHGLAGSITGGMAGLLLDDPSAKAYRPNTAQRELARYRGQRAMADDLVRGSNAKCIAVLVPSVRGERDPLPHDLMLVKKSDGHLLTDKVYEVRSKSQLTNGTLIRISGYEAIVYNPR